MFIMLPSIHFDINTKGRLYEIGKRFPTLVREQVLNLSHLNFSQRQVSEITCTSRHFVQNVLLDYNETNSSLPRPRSSYPRTKISPDVLDYIEVEKLLKPSIYSYELKENLVLDGVVAPQDVPSKSTISKCVRNDLMMTHKKIQATPLEYITPHNIALVNDYLDQVSDLNPGTLHFFDESSVVKTTGNRNYGSSYIGQPALEFQRYASNATYTVNLLHSMHGVDFLEVLQGPSNGHKMLFFFEEALQIHRRDGSAVLERGDIVIMDNCGFHHGHFIEPLLNDMLSDYGVRLLFQPPYSPHLIMFSPDEMFLEK